MKKKVVIKKLPNNIPAGVLNSLPQYGLGSWLKDNAGVIGTIAGAGIGTLIAPGIGTKIGASLGGAAGGAVQSADAQDDAIALQKEQTAQAQRLQSKNNFVQNYMNAQQANQQVQYSNNFACGGKMKANGGILDSYAKGGTIYIKPENRGKFTATKQRTGKTTEKLTHSKNPLTRKRAIFAQNSRKFNHEDGGYLDSNEVFANGGKLVDITKDLDNVTVYANGGSHQNNPLGGIPIGNKGLVEQDEVRFGNYVFSNRF